MKLFGELGISDIVRFHHERFDRKGYPHGLKGTEIPLGARILGVADAFDAMTTNRSYRQKLAIETATDELKRYSGTQFDWRKDNALAKTLQEYDRKEIRRLLKLNIKLIKALWGMESLSLEEQFARIASAGCYTGIESSLPSKDNEKQFRELLSKHQFDYIAMVFTGGEDHLTSFQEQLEQAAAFKPLFINAHSSKDSMPYDKQLAFYEQAIIAEKNVGIQVGHETHRGIAMFTPWGTAQLLKDLPDLKITADFSHWCCVCESLLEDQADSLKLAFERTIHIHSRVGYAEGPQVPHPAAPEYQHELETHEGWWQQIVDLWDQKSTSPITLTPEFGPPGYMHTLPFTNQPVADLWEVCLWMAKRLKGL